jgi:hypothetical protein
MIGVHQEQKVAKRKYVRLMVSAADKPANVVLL